MATFQLGNMITQINGSIGGTTFRRVGNMNVISNKSAGAAQNTLLSNKRLSSIRQIFTAFLLLDQQTKIDFQTVSNLHPVMDKYGNTKILTARQFFTKYNCQLLPVNKVFDSPLDFDTTLVAFDIKSFIIDTTLLTATVSFENVTAETFILFQVVRKSSATNTTPIKRHKFLLADEYSVDGSVNLYSQISERFGNIKAGQNYTVIVYGMNKYGVRSTGQTLPATFV